MFHSIFVGREFDEIVSSNWDDQTTSTEYCTALALYV